MAVTNLDDEPTRAAKLLGWMFLGSAGMLGLLLLLPTNDYYRWQQGDGTILFRARYVYERIHDDPRPIDVAMIGSSRIEASVRAEEVAAGLSRSLGRPMTVVNFGLPQEGRDLQWAVAKELLNTRQDVKLIVLILGPEQANSHPGFRFIGDDASIAGAPVLYNPSYFPNLLSLPYRDLAYFVQGLWPWAFRLSPIFDGEIYKARSFDPTQTFRMPDGTLVDRSKVLTLGEVGIQLRVAKPGRFSDPKLGYLAMDHRYAIERHYTRRIVDLARKKNVEVAFLQVPQFRVEEQVDDKEFYAAFGPVIDDAPVGNDPADYMDLGHLNRSGTAKLAPWLVDRLAPILRKAEGKR